MTSRVAILVVVAATAALVVGLFTAGLEGGPGITDTPRLSDYGERIVGGDVPYRDFRVEYPPGALAPVRRSLRCSRRSQAATTRSSRREMIFALAAAACSSSSRSRPSVPRPRASSCPSARSSPASALLGPFLLTRFDLFAATRHPRRALRASSTGAARSGPLLLGVAIATKIYPAVLLPLSSRGPGAARAERRRCAALALTLVASLAVYLPFAILSPEGVLRSVWRQLGRPLQIESLGVGRAARAPPRRSGCRSAGRRARARRTSPGPSATVAAGLTTIAGIAALALVWVRYARGDIESDARFVRYAAAAVVAFVAFGKVVSPQFLIWLLGIVVLVPGPPRRRRDRAAARRAAGSRALWFPRTYWELVKQFDPDVVVARARCATSSLVGALRRARRRLRGQPAVRRSTAREPEPA